MKRFLALLVSFTLFAALVPVAAMPVSANDHLDAPMIDPLVIESVRDGISPAISSLVAGTASAFALSTLDGTISTAEVPMFMLDPGMLPLRAASESAGKKAPKIHIQDSNGPLSADLLQQFDGSDNDDNGLVAGILLAPPDTDGDVGPNHYVQMINVVTTIFDKNGNNILGPFPNNLFWTGLGGLCETTNRGDPIVLYDEETDRWLVSQFAFDNGFTAYSLCVAISTTGDPTGTYYQHEFDFTDISFPDYPKYGFVTDAIGVMVNLFTPPSFDFGGTGLGAIDKAEAFSDQPTTMVFFNVGTNNGGFVAGDNDGPIFDNMPPTFATNNEGVFSNDRIDFWEIDPDFANPANSTISEVASIPVAPFDSELCPAPRGQCIDQPGSGTGTPPQNVTFLEGITDRLMHRLQLRSFAEDQDGNGPGKGKRAVVTHTIDVDGNGKAGIRWYEFWDKGKGWKLFQQGTFSPDGDHRWMGSIAMNAAGDICVGYSISSQQTFTSIGAACQTQDASGSGKLNVAELGIFGGQNVQRQTARWGDYSAMAIDPLDGTFWYTQEYARPFQVFTQFGERFGWATKITQFQTPGEDN
jgi:hypothetical protein